MTTPRLTVLAGLTAVGKRTVVQTLRLRRLELVASVSATAHVPQLGEIDGVHYCFLNGSQLDELIEDGEMLGWAEVHGLHRYGTLRRPVEETLTTDKSVLLGIDLDGARQVRHSIPEAHFVFLAPPSWDVLVVHLFGRGIEDEEEGTRRLETARTELAAESEFDIAVTSDDLNMAVAELTRVMDLE